MSDQFPIQGFDDWAESYDAAVTGDGFPFAGYQEVLDKVVELAEPHPGMAVLDLGAGTGNLAARFGALGCELWCTDFAPAMLEKAKAKLPQARFIQHDLRSGPPPELDRRMDRIVSAYVFHHFDLDEKIRIIHDLAGRLTPGGWIVLADIAFPDMPSLEQVRIAAGEEWEQEFYWLASEALPALERAGCQVAYQQVSLCAGVFKIVPAVRIRLPK